MTAQLDAYCGCGRLLDTPGRDICFECYCYQQHREPVRGCDHRIDAFINETTRCFGAPPASIIVRQGAEIMKKFDDTNRGVLFRETDKQSDKHPDKHPDYTGNINVGSIEYWLNGWLNTSKKGTKFLSLSIRPRDERKGKHESDDDSIAF
jgi:hypothetical protein